MFREGRGLPSIPRKVEEGGEGKKVWETGQGREGSREEGGKERGRTERKKVDRTAETAKQVKAHASWPDFNPRNPCYKNGMWWHNPHSPKGGREVETGESPRNLLAS